jgi:SAM-dependent methyltransferase
VADRSIDVITSNCVINLSPDKAAVYREAFRVLKPGGRLAISDLVTTAELPEEARNDLALIASCVSGATPGTRLRGMLEEAGFREISIHPAGGGDLAERDWEPGAAVTDYVVAVVIQARRPLEAAA